MEVKNIYSKFTRTHRLSYFVTSITLNYERFS